jgi:hypothetical protein
LEDRIKNKDKIQQFVNFDGCQFGKISPTDVDALFEIGNKLLILIEIKENDKLVPHGQRLALERICDAWQSAKGPSVILKAVYHPQMTIGDVFLKDMFVYRYYNRGKWTDMSPRRKVPETVEAFVKKFGLQHLLKNQ